MSSMSSPVHRLRVVGAVAVAYLGLYGVVTLWWLRASGVDGLLLNAAVCLAPAVLGAVLASTSTEDRNQYLARILACLAFVPVLLLFWATSQDPAVPVVGHAVWPFAVGAALGHAASFVGMIFWGGSYATMVPAVSGVAPAAADALVARLMSLNTLGAPLEVTRTDTDAATVSLRHADGAHRGQEVTLKLLPQRALVMVGEKLSANMARPASEEESSMRGPTDSYFDPTRPSASRVSGTTFQTSMIDPQRLATLRVSMFGSEVELPDTDAKGLDSDGIVTLLCAVVTRSGWRWQPVFFGARPD